MKQFCGHIFFYSDVWTCHIFGEKHTAWHFVTLWQNTEQQQEGESSMVLLCWWYRISTDNRGSVRPSIRSSFVVRRNQNSKRYCDLIDMHAEHAKEILYPISLKVIGVHSIKVAPFLVAKGGRYLELCREKRRRRRDIESFLICS